MNKEVDSKDTIVTRHDARVFNNNMEMTGFNITQPNYVQSQIKCLGFVRFQIACSASNQINALGFALFPTAC